MADNTGLDTGPTLRVNGLSLRPFRAEDVTARYVSWLNDDDVNLYSRRQGAQTTRDDATAYIDALQKDEVIFAINHPTFGHVGNIKYGPIDWDNRRSDISILIGEKRAWGKGVARAAMHGVGRYLFEDLKLNRLDAGSANPAFIKSAEAIGWRIEGVLRQRVWMAGAFWDWTLLSLLSAEFNPALYQETQ